MSSIYRKLDTNEVYLQLFVMVEDVTKFILTDLPQLSPCYAR
jgi:hypothetical protein